MYNAAFLFFGGSMKIFILALCAVLFLGCSNSDDNKVDLEINYLLEQGRTCKDYFADHFLLNVYDSEQRSYITKEIPCDNKDDEKLIFSVDKDSYFVSVVLLDDKDMWQSYGATKADILSDTKLTINMERYEGGLSFEWKSDNCDKYNVSVMNFDLNLKSDGTPVHAVLWGEDTEIKDYQVPCAAGHFEIINIDWEPDYSVKINAFRTPLSFMQSRVSYENDKFVSGHGQNRKIDLDDSAKITKKVLVSDMKVSWEFDSKSIESCDDAKVKKVKAVLASDSYTISSEQNCDDEYSDFYLYDIIQKSYTLSLYGYSEDDKILFETTEKLGEIKPGSIGKEILEKKILLKEK